MSLEYDLDQRLKDLVPVLEDYTEWFMQVVRHVTYPASNGNTRQLHKPTSFSNWVEGATRDEFQPETVKKLRTLHKDLLIHADGLMAAVSQSGKPPEFKDFDKLITLFEEFADHLHRLEKDCLLENNGLDPLTGLRGGHVIHKDFKREMERLSRQGKPFSIALVKIDNLASELDQETFNQCMEIVSTLIKRSLRTFDDAYRLENNEFVLSLKQADMTGGVQALERLRGELEKKNAEVMVKGKKVPLTLSSCIAEPMPGDSLDDLLDNLRVDLKAIGKEDGAVFEYMEMSPLQRYLKKGQE